MEPSDPSKLVESLLNEEGDDFDPKEYAQSTPVGSALFEEFMSNYREACMKLLESAKRSGALDGSEQEGFVIRAVMKIAVDRLFYINDPAQKKLLRNLERFI